MMKNKPFIVITMQMVGHRLVISDPNAKISVNKEAIPFFVDEDITSDGQGFWKPCGYMDKGTMGKGQGTDFKTLEKPLPLSRVRGYP